MKEFQEQGSKLRSARCEELVERMAELAVMLPQPSRRCSERNGKIKTNLEIHSGETPTGSIALAFATETAKPARRPRELHTTRQTNRRSWRRMSLRDRYLFFRRSIRN